jgi:hypothetical protein
VGETVGLAAVAPCSGKKIKEKIAPRPKREEKHFFIILPELFIIPARPCRNNQMSLKSR